MTASQRDGQRERILRAAVQLFSQRGYHASSLKQLARRAGMTAPNLYHYYSSKEEILFEVHSIQLTSLIEKQEELISIHDDLAERLWYFAYNMVHTDLEDELASFIPSSQLTGLTGKNAKIVREYMRTVREQWISTIEEGAEAGIFKVNEPHLSALNALTLCSYTTSWFDPKGRFSTDVIAKDVAVSCLRIVGCQHWSS